MFWHFDHRYGTYKGQTEKTGEQGCVASVSDAQHNDPEYRIVPRYWVDAGLTYQALAEDVSANWFFSWRDVGPSERTFVGTIIPRTAIGHTAPIIIATTPARERASLCALLSSLVVDYAARQKSSRMTYFIVEQLPIIAPANLSEEKMWLGIALRDWLADRVLELCYTNEELSSLAVELGCDHLPFRWQPDRRVYCKPKSTLLSCTCTN